VVAASLTKKQGVDAATAGAYVRATYSVSVRGEYYNGHLPETNEQDVLAKQVVPLVTKNKRK